jgi:hypothetical protein
MELSIQQVIGEDEKFDNEGNAEMLWACYSSVVVTSPLVNVFYAVISAQHQRLCEGGGAQRERHMKAWQPCQAC